MQVLASTPKEKWNSSSPTGPRPYAVAHALSNVTTAEPSTGPIELTHIDHPPLNTERKSLGRPMVGSTDIAIDETVTTPPTSARHLDFLMPLNLDGFHQHTEVHRRSCDPLAVTGREPARRRTDVRACRARPKLRSVRLAAGSAREGSRRRHPDTT